MARVPIPAAGQGTELLPISGNHLVPVDATAGLTQVGGALQQTGQTAGAMATTQEQINDTLDEAAVRQADNEAAKRARDLLWTGDNAFYSQQGFNAANARAGVETGLQSIREDISGRLTSDRQRRLFGQVYDRRIGMEEEGIARHVTTEVRAENHRQGLARITQASDDAVSHWADLPQRETFIATALGEVRHQASDLGWAPDVLRRAEVEMRSNITTRAIQGILDRGDVELAQSNFNEHRADLLPDAATQIETALHGPLLDREGVRAAVLAINGGDPPDVAEPAAGGAAPAAGAAPARGGIRAPVNSPAASIGVQLRAGNIPAVVAAGFLGNMHWESALAAHGPNGDGGDAAGIVQWHADRRAVFERVMHVPFSQSTREQQVQFVLYEMAHPEEAGMTVAHRDLILASRTPEEAARRIDQYYERSAGGAREQRAAAARRFYDGDAAPEASAPRPQEHDLTAIMTRLEAMRLPFDVEQRARREVISRVGLDEQLLTRVHERAAEGAYAYVERLGPSFTSVNQIPSTIRSQLTAEQRLQFDAVGRRNAEQSHPTNWQQYSRYSDMYASDPVGFARLNPAELRANLGNSEFEAVMGWRRDAQTGGGPGRTPAQVTHEHVRSVTDPMLLAAGIMRPPPVRPDGGGASRPDPAADTAYFARVGQFQRAVNLDVEHWRAAHPNATIADNDIQDIADRQLMHMWRRGAGDDPDHPGHHAGEVFAFERDPAGAYQTAIPHAATERIRQVYRARQGRDPTPDEIIEIYRYGPRGGR